MSSKAAVLIQIKEAAAETAERTQNGSCGGIRRSRARRGKRWQAARIQAGRLCESRQCAPEIQAGRTAIQADLNGRHIWQR